MQYSYSYTAMLLWLVLEYNLVCSAHVWRLQILTEVKTIWLLQISFSSVINFEGTLSNTVWTLASSIYCKTYKFQWNDLFKKFYWHDFCYSVKIKLHHLHSKAVYNFLLWLHLRRENWSENCSLQFSICLMLKNFSCHCV